ncbi:hypothetical protein QCA50_009278 [Cerrena zonata]|uniref:COPII coat assembly protein SEC16 n=1 Tax=Cerrena zonata TaxID=2478898 RepID=A0AAW0G0Y4_9APHY
MNNGKAFTFVGSQTLTSLYSEIYEYSLKSAPNASVPAAGFPHLLILKLRHAQLLADYGLFNESQKYCDAIGANLKSMGKTNFFGPSAFHEFQTLLMRISESNTPDGGWFDNKISRVNLNKFWGQLDKFIGGDEPKAKSNESGPFSKFSPSVSRTASTIDVTAIPQTSPRVVNDFRDGLASGSAPSSSTDMIYGGLLGLSRPPIISNPSNASVSKYSPSPSGNVYTKQTVPAIQRSEQHQQSPLANLQQTPAPPPPISSTLASPGNSRYQPSNASTHSLQLNDSTNDGLLPPKKAQSKYSPVAQKSNLGSARSYPYSNKAAQSSTLSIASHISIQPTPGTIPPPVAVTGPSGSQKRPSIGSIVSGDIQNDGSSQHIHQHQRNLSDQSDISLDYPLDFKSTPKKLGGGFHDFALEEKKEPEHIPETIKESPEKEALQFSNSKNNLNDFTLDEKKVEAHEIPAPYEQAPLAQTNEELYTESESGSRTEASVPQMTSVPQRILQPQEPSQELVSEQDPQELSTRAPDARLAESVNKEEMSSTSIQPSKAAPPPPRGPALRSSKAKVNPYAPGGANRQTRPSRYSSSTKGASKYSAGSSNNSLYTGPVDNVSYGDFIRVQTEGRETFG